MGKSLPEDRAADPLPARPGPVLRVTAPSGLRRRAGFAFGPSPVDLAPGQLDAAAREALLVDPLLVIREVDAEGDEPPSQA